MSDRVPVYNDKGKQIGTAGPFRWIEREEVNKPSRFVEEFFNALCEVFQELEDLKAENQRLRERNTENVTMGEKCFEGDMVAIENGVNILKGEVR